MTIRKFLWIVSLSGFIVGCGTQKVLVPLYKDKAEAVAVQGDYLQAVELWKQYFNQQPIEQTEGAIFAQAAKTAFKNDDPDLALSWFDQARYKNYADAEMYETLAKIFKKKKNISKELNSLEYITENFSEDSAQIDDRLFDVYIEIGSNEKALQVWERLDVDSKNKLLKLDSYFLIHKALKDSTVCDSLSLVLLARDPGHVEALEWTAKKFYWLGENRYQREMAEYEKEKTPRQYKILLKELDKATADFKKSLIYFERLWKIKPGEKYASYFTNIYARFGDEKKSKFYGKLVK